MDLLKVLHKEEQKLLTEMRKFEVKLSQVRTAINALGTHGQRPHKLKGKKLSAAHRRAIKAGIAKRKKEKAASN